MAETPKAKGSQAVPDLDDEGPDGILGWMRELFAAWGPAIAAVLLIRAFIFEPFKIPSGSMVPTLLVGDHVLVTKFSYGVWLRNFWIWLPTYDNGFGLYGIHVPMPTIELLDLSDPDRGDVIVFRYPRDETINYIKRVVAVPGDRIRVENNKIFINDVAQVQDKLGTFNDVDSLCTPRPANHWNEHLTRSGGTVLDHEVLTSTGLGGALANKGEVTVPEGQVFAMGDNRDNSEDSRRWGFVRYDQIKGKAHFVWLSWDSCGAGSPIRFDRFFRSLYTPPGGG